MRFPEDSISWALINRPWLRRMPLLTIEKMELCVGRMVMTR